MSVIDLGAWTTKSGIPLARYNMGMGTLNSKLYAIAGSYWNGSRIYVSKVDVYDSYTNAWTSVADLPTALESPTVATFNDKIYVFGGSDSIGSVIKTVYEYDPRTNTWNHKNDMPTARSSAGAIVIKGKIYVAGGFNTTGDLNTVDIFDPILNSWTSGVSMPTARNGFAIALVKGKMYIIGGHNGSGYLNKVESFDFVTGGWNTGTNMPTARVAQGAVVNNRIYVVGGTHQDLNGGSNNVSLNITEEYNPDTDTWKVMADMPTARFSVGVAAINNIIYAVSGFNSSTYVTTVEAFTPPDDVPEETIKHTLLRITMNDSSEREYRLSSAEIDDFIKWYDRTVGTGNTCYVFDDIIDNSKEYLAFEKIISFKVIPLAK